MVSPVIAKIISLQQSLTVSENEIAQYVIHNADKVVTSTITAIAQSTDTSEASINRFCKKIGFKGFNSFKIALAQENFYNSMKEEPNMDEGFISSVSRDYRHMLVNTSAMLDEVVVKQAATALAHAERVYIFSLAFTELVAQELEFKLSMVGIHAKSASHVSDIKLCASNVGPNDLVIVIVPTLLVRELYHAITLCKDKGAQIVTITSYDSPKLSVLVDYKFIISDKIITQNSISISNNITFLYVTDVIYSTMLELNKPLKQKRLNSDAILNSQPPTDNYFFEF